MYAVVRPALRSGSTATPLIQILRCRRYPSPLNLRLRSRSFHATRSLTQTPNAPPSANNASADESDVVKNDSAKAATEEAGEQTDAGVAAEDLEVIAQKLQRSREMTRRYTAALRRTQRKNRVQDMPPIHIPEWFLKTRVALREDCPQDVEQEKTVSLTITHTESGKHATCSLPFWSYARGVSNISEMVQAMWRSKGLTEEQRKEFARDFAKRIGVADETIVKALERGEELNIPDLSGKSIALLETSRKAEFNASERRANSSVKGPDVESAMDPQDAAFAHEQDRSGRRISPLILAEIRATIAASLSTNLPTTDSFPSSKTNLVLHSPSDDSEPLLVKSIYAIAAELEADVIRLQPQDIAQIIGDYIGEGPEPSPHSIRSLGYETYKSGPEFGNGMEESASEDAVEDEADPNANVPSSPEFLGMAFPGDFGRKPFGLSILANVKDAITHLKSMESLSPRQGEDSPADSQSRNQSQSEVQLEDLKIATCLEVLIDSNELKRAHGLTRHAENAGASHENDGASHEKSDDPSFFSYSITSSTELDLSSCMPPSAQSDFTFTVNVQPFARTTKGRPKSTIIHVQDIKELDATQYGGRILEKLTDIVRRRRLAGEHIMILGTTCSLDLTPELTSAGVHGLQSDHAAEPFRVIVVPVAPLEVLGGAGILEGVQQHDVTTAIRARAFQQRPPSAQDFKIKSINMWHIRDMLRRLDPVATEGMTSEEEGLHKEVQFRHVLSKSFYWGVMSYDEVHRVSLIALGLHLTDPHSTQLSWVHVTLAMGLMRASDEVKCAHVAHQKATETEIAKSKRARFMEQIERRQSQPGADRLQKRSAVRNLEEPNAAARAMQLTRIAMSATPYEKRLMPGIANPDQIKTTFDQVHVPKETVEAIRSLTSLSLLRPDAFDYGVLATEKISGALLYGPPGTGKTMLAKATAKESGSTVLEVSGSSIMDKYVGEGEKNVSAIFSLARKLSPCIVFIDEADAILASRNSGRERTSHRDILNQFLKEWDGLNDLSVFVMVATNRPFDLDDAVIRRLPRRLLVDLPTQEDRREILKIHLKGEQLDESVDLEDLSKRTPLYSGSDLKNVAVSAALACVKEENENAAIAAAKAASEAEAEAEAEAESQAKAASETAGETDTSATATETKAKSETLATEADTEEPTTEEDTETSNPATEEKESEDPGATAATIAQVEALLTKAEKALNLTPSTTPPPPSQVSPPSTPPRLVRGQKYTFPERRILHARHFDAALLDISASISEDMASLGAVKKFDEQYGDRKGRRKKNAYGFGVQEQKESNARVRG
ncbi:AAA-domain-containing protein [Pleomassaria siparia CBS 279.74]|uniref:AAA-domain-containing protein n=1 Tax=Pleomassaria siparia CBS 279.74 TaxID=1314801 RepID=A0A6G1K631_9PLEO|nr:AAA-domain-containing protein [Pleomassaria siparia CBS 279.74]